MSGLLKITSLNISSFIIIDISLADIEDFERIEQLAEKKKRATVIAISRHEKAVVRAAKLYANSFGLYLGRAFTKPFKRGTVIVALGPCE